MHEEYGEDKYQKVSSPAADGLFDIDKNSQKLSDAEQEKFHKIVAKGLFLSKRARPDVQPVIAFLCTRVKCPTEQDKEKLHMCATKR